MIGKEHFKSKIAELGKAFNYAYTAGQQQALFDEISGYTPFQLDRSVIYLINTKPPKLPPSNAEIMQAVREIANQEWTKKKEKERQEAQEVFYGEQGKKTPHIKDTMILVMEMLSQTLERTEVIKRMKAMDSRYPQYDWNVIANKMESFYQRKGLI